MASTQLRDAVKRQMIERIVKCFVTRNQGPFRAYLMRAPYELVVRIEARCIARMDEAFGRRRAALNLAEAAAELRINRTTLWRLCNLPANDPRRIRTTSYNTVPRAEIERHLKAELQARN